MSIRNSVKKVQRFHKGSAVGTSRQWLSPSTVCEGHGGMVLNSMRGEESHGETG